MSPEIQRPAIIQFSNWTDSTNSSALFNDTEVLGDPAGAMLANGTGNPDDALQYPLNATETPVDPLPVMADTGRQAYSFVWNRRK
jgi:hypothetical protein